MLARNLWNKKLTQYVFDRLPEQSADGYQLAVNAELSGLISIGSD
jgi:hypothetical protein